MDDLNQQPNPSDWRGHLTDDLKADPVVSEWASKASEKDIASLIKTTAHSQKRMGSAINLPGKEAKPEEVAALRTKLYEAGVFKAPPGKPEDYGLADPGNLPQGITFSPELAGKFSTAMHKHGIPKEALADLLPVYMEAIQGQVSTLKTDSDKIMAGLRTEHGDKFDERWELADRLAKEVFKSDAEIEFLAKSGAGPLLYGPLMRLAHFAGQDSSYMDSLGNSGALKGDEALSELTKIRTDPNHPMHLGYKNNDAKVMQHIQELYSKAYGKEVVNV